MFDFYFLKNMYCDIVTIIIVVIVTVVLWAYRSPAKYCIVDAIIHKSPQCKLIMDMLYVDILNKNLIIIFYTSIISYAVSGFPHE